MGALIASSDFTDTDDDEFEPVHFKLKWRLKADPSKRGEETFECHPDVPFGVLLDVEGGEPSAGFQLLMAALRSDDHKMVKGEPTDGTSSAERFHALTHDRTKKLPALAIREAMRGLLVEYTNRRAPRAAAGRPTPLSGPSSGPRSSTGTTSRAKQRAKVSTSGRSAQATA